MPPGYPFYLAAIYLFTGHNQLAGKLGNVLLGGALAGVVYLLARSLATRRIALVSGLLVALWPDLIFQSSILSSDLLCAFGFVTVMWSYCGLHPASGRRDPAGLRRSGSAS